MSPTRPAVMTRKKLPIGIQTFSNLREEGCYYVDKTSKESRSVVGFEVESL